MATFDPRSQMTTMPAPPATVLTFDQITTLTEYVESLRLLESKLHTAGRYGALEASAAQQATKHINAALTAVMSNTFDKKIIINHLQHAMDAVTGVDELMISVSGAIVFMTYFFNKTHSTADHQALEEVRNLYERFPFEKYRIHLEKKEKEIKLAITQHSGNDETVDRLHAELTLVEHRLLNKEAGYQAHITDIKDRINRLNDLQGKISEQWIAQAKAALAKGNRTETDQMFTQVEENAASHPSAVAEAAYQHGKLAEDAVDYQDAYRHYERASQLAPKNSTYLSVTGRLAHELGSYDAAIHYYEQALASNQESVGEETPHITIFHNRLGKAWDDKGDHDKAIGYYELSLTSNLKHFGETHLFDSGNALH